MKKPKILVVGSLNMDLTASTELFPNSGETVSGKTFKTAAGGKGSNQAAQAARLGAEVTMLGKLGKDANGKALFDIVSKEGINTEHIIFDDNVSTGTAIIILEEKPGQDTKNRILIIPGTNGTINEDDVAFLKDEIKNYDMIILQLEIPMFINELVAKYAYDAGVPVMLNSAPSAPLSDELLSHLTYISPNEHEAKDITGVEIKYNGDDIDMESVKMACEALRDKGIKNALITLGGSGAALLNDTGFYHYPCIKGLNVVDPTAAGDSFVGAFCSAISLGWNTEEVLKFANYTAALTVCGYGALPSLPTLKQVEEFMLSRGETLPDTSSLH